MSATLLITTFNRGSLLRHSFERLCTLTLPDEIIVVDDGGQDDTEEVCRNYSDRLPIRYVFNNNPGPTICSLARNVGLRLAAHEFIITSEPELIFMSDLISDLQVLASDYPNDVISAGHIYLGPPSYVVDFNNMPPAGCEEAVGWVAPHSALYRKSWLEEIGGWDEHFPGPWGWDDTDLLTRLRINGHGQHRALDLRALHQFHGTGADPGSMNENYWMTKTFHADWDDRSDVIANKGEEWGRLREGSRADGVPPGADVPPGAQQGDGFAAA